jgi:cold shock CspA family protein
VTVPRAAGEDLGGVVATFGEHVGLGAIALDDGREVPFHSTQLGDGTRRIDVGTRVTARVVRWHRGTLEATSVDVA